MDKINANGIVAESSARKRCMTKLWEQESKRMDINAESTSGKGLVELERLASWLDLSPVTNALTHYAVVMDPSSGTFAWERHYTDPRALWDHLNGHDRNKKTL